ETVAKRIFARPFFSMRRRLRVSSRTASSPSFGRRIVRAPAPATPTRTSLFLFRIRNDARAVAFLLKRGNLVGLPARLPFLPSENAASALPRSTAASSKTCWLTSLRHARPVLPSSSTPASEVSFHALNALIRSNPDHGTATLASVFFAS